MPRRSRSLASLLRRRPAATLTLLAALGAVLPADAAGPDRDAELRRRLVGTWLNVDSAVTTEVRGETTYTADGRILGWDAAEALDPKGRRMRIKLRLRGHWSIRRGMIHLSGIESATPAVEFRGNDQHYQVVAITPDELTFRDPVRRTIVHRVRKPVVP